jgi:hypothetical protein
MAAPYRACAGSARPAAKKLYGTLNSMKLDRKSTVAPIPPEWEADFEAASRRPLAVRFRYSFIRTYKPVLDDASYRAFTTLEEYRDWCERNLPSWLGYGRV